MCNKTAITAGLLFAVLFAAAPLQAKQAAIQQTEARALSGNITAQITLADTFRTKQDIVQAKYWYRKAAEQNNPYAQNERKTDPAQRSVRDSITGSQSLVRESRITESAGCALSAGVMYYRGKGCERGDCAIARSFMRERQHSHTAPLSFTSR